jgi:hypothetical protein
MENLSEYEERRKSIRKQVYKEKIFEPKTIYFWGIIAIINNQKIKVVLRKVEGTDQIHFWSVIPDWVTSPTRDVKLLKNNS